MTNFTKTRLTDKGLALLAKEGVSVTITKVKTGSGEYQADENTGEMTQLKSEKQQFEVLSATKKSDTVGVYATDPDEGEILYAVCYATNENADIIRKFNGLFDFKAIIVLNISVNAGGTVKFISEGMYALAEDVQELSQKFSKHIEDKNVHVTEEEKKKIADIVIPKEIQGTLSAGKTELALSSEKISVDSTIDIYTDVYGVSPKTATVADGSITMTFKAQTKSVQVKVVVK